jgi:hypothetical protein
MSLENTLYLAILATACSVFLVMLYRANSRTAPRLLVWNLVIGLPLAADCLALLLRNPRDMTLMTGVAAIVVPYIVGFILVERFSRRREGLVFVPTGICSFRETAVSGRSCDAPLVRIGGATRCLTVTVTEDELWVAPAFPISAFARVRGLVNRVPLLRIHLMEKLAGRKANIRLEYTGQDGWCRCVELKLRNPSAFIDAVREGQWEGVR